MTQENNSDTSILKTIVQSLVWIWVTLSKLIGSLFLVILILVVVVGVLISNQQQALDQFQSQVINQAGSEQVAVVELNGEIVSYAEQGLLSFDPFVITPSRTQQLFKQLEQEPAVKAVLLKVNSPGGSVVASEEIYQQIKQLSQAKPVVAYMVDAAASGGYYILAPATKIVANQATITGSVGVIAFSPDVSGLYEKLGVTVNTYKTGQYKDMGSPHRPETDAEREIYQQVLTDSFDLFIKRIKQERDISSQNLELISDGRIFSGLRAKELGLVDQVGSSVDALNLAIELSGTADPSVVKYNFGRGVFTGLISSKLNSWSLISPASLMPERRGAYFLWQQ
mgnify:CR=1 FL=1